MYLISPLKKQYKANLHCHSVLSDGKKTPEELKAMYKDNGYSILSITDHERPCNHTDLTDDDFIMITGYEAYIRDNKECKGNPYKPEIHLNLFAENPENVSYICFNPAACRYCTEEEKEQFIKVGSQKQREYTVEYINEFVKTALDNGYICSHNHPYWSLENEDMILKYEGFFSMEMCNFSSFIINGLEYNARLYDKLILSGKKIFCHSADDNHNHAPENSLAYDSFGAFTMIMPEKFTYDEIFKAMKKGEMYSSMGPLFKEVSMDGNKIHIETSPVQSIRVFTGNRKPNRRLANRGETINSADFELDDSIKFIRVSIVDEYGNYADTRAFLREELEF